MLFGYNYTFFILFITKTMLLISDGNSEIGAQVLSEGGSLICLYICLDRQQPQI